MKVVHAYNQHRGGGGSNNATRATIDVSQARGVATTVFTRCAGDLPATLRGRVQAGLAALSGRRTVQEFESLLHSVRPDLVHVHEIFPLVSPWILPLCKRRGIPVVMSCVDYRMTCPVVTHLRAGKICTRCTDGHAYWAILGNCRRNLAESTTVALYSTMVRTLGLYDNNVDHFIVPSQFTRNWLLQHLQLSPDRVTAIAPVVDIPSDVADPGCGEYVGFAGRFAAEKGIDILLEAARRAKLPVRFSRNENSLVTVDLPADARVVITRGRDDLAEFYRKARMLVVPSIWFETFALVGAEAMSHGIPIVAARIGAVAELVDDGVDGLHFDPRDPGDLAAKMRRIWDDAQLRGRMATAARAKAQSYWSADRHFEHLHSVYQLARRRSPLPDVVSALAAERSRNEFLD